MIENVLNRRETYNVSSKPKKRRFTSYLYVISSYFVGTKVVTQERADEHKYVLNVIEKDRIFMVLEQRISTINT